MLQGIESVAAASKAASAVCAWLALGTLAASAAGCGQKGPLLLPPSAASAASPGAAASAPVPPARPGSAVMR
jgi:predicted small lipoprotein YifL